ncbi:uncharacterized protein LOC132730491 isoform X2 [Ruditapes philippinarum]|uniref:uncharacterized protein LOC132730491 isoform X2 n=1 Tax=Ruditapes philippinarum TaxID=129788 RepID=UPI00295B6F43|nr:uncharacterized protein LOC132730491 isoform X2 [Ruditapes philippinarum]
MSKFEQRRQQVLTPALEGSKPIRPSNSLVPYGYRPFSQGDRGPDRPFTQEGREPRGFRGRPFTPGGRNIMGSYPRGFHPGVFNGYPYMNVMPAERVSVPTLLQRPRMPYLGPPSLMPQWGGYSIGPQYFPERKVIPVPVRMPKYIPPPQPPIYNPQPPPHPPKKTVRKKSSRTFPGSEPLGRFRYTALAVVFIARLRANVKQNLSNRPSSTFLFGIILKEIVAALHRIYLNPNGNIYPVLNDIIGPNCYDLASLVHGGQIDGREESVLVQELQYVIENIIYHITEIMPSTGVLGTHRKSAVFELIKSGKRFPNGYFWQVEMDRLQFTEQGRTHNVTDSESFMLLLGIFISRSLVTTILMKPLDYGLCSEPLSEVAERNLRIVASAILFLVRRISIQRGRGIMEMPSEIGKYLYSDDEMQHVYSRLSRTFNYCEGLLREWGTEYIRRLRASYMQKQ